MKWLFRLKKTNDTVPIRSVYVQAKNVRNRSVGTQLPKRFGFDVSLVSFVCLS